MQYGIYLHVIIKLGILLASKIKYRDKSLRDAPDNIFTLKFDKSPNSDYCNMYYGTITTQNGLF